MLLVKNSQNVTKTFDSHDDDGLLMWSRWIPMRRGYRGAGTQKCDCKHDGCGFNFHREK